MAPSPMSEVYIIWTPICLTCRGASVIYSEKQALSASHLQQSGAGVASVASFLLSFALSIQQESGSPGSL